MRSQYSYFRVVVCDNASSDDSLEKIKNWAKGDQGVPKANDLDSSLENLIYPPISKPIHYIFLHQEEAELGGKEEWDVPLILIQNNANGGFSRGNNAGIRFALRKKADYIWLLNNDTVVEANTLKEMVYRMQSDTKIGLIGSVIYYAAMPTKIQTWGGGRIFAFPGIDRFIHSPGTLDYICGTSLFIRREVLEQIGLLDEGFFFYWEDADFGKRAIENGWRLGVASNSRVYHKFSATVGSQSLKSDLYKIASLTRYYRKHYKGFGRFQVAFNISGMVLKRLARGQFNRIWPIIKESFKVARQFTP